MKIFSFLNSNKSDSSLLSNNYENSEIERLKILFRKFSNFDLVIDAGAAMGTWGITLKNTTETPVHLIGIEPLPMFLSKLNELEIYDEIFPYVISGTSGQTELHVSEDLFSSSLLYKGESSLKVEARTLESIIDQIPLNLKKDKIFLKLDLQGMDYIALVSAGKYIKSIAAIQMECQLAPYARGMEFLSERIRKMSELNFEIFDIYGHLDRPSDGALGQVDILFVNRNLNGLVYDIW